MQIFLFGLAPNYTPSQILTSYICLNFLILTQFHNVNEVAQTNKQTKNPGSKFHLAASLSGSLTLALEQNSDHHSTLTHNKAF